jgi:subtilisin family serine protease
MAACPLLFGRRMDKQGELMSRHFRITIFSLVSTLFVTLLTWESALGQYKIAPILDSMLNTPNQPDTNIDVIIFLNNETPKQAISAIAQNVDLNRSGRIKAVMNRLMSQPTTASVSQVIDFVERNSSIKPTRHWIAPTITASLTVSKIRTLASLPGVKAIVPNVTLQEVTPVEVKSAPAMSTSVASELNLLRVPELWQRGINGHGRLVCSFDTGVEESHPALMPKWRGNHASLTSSWFSKVAPDTLPYDKAGHGTHTMGIMVGSVGVDSFGVAPGAEWIAAGVIDQGRPLNTTINDILDAFQWALNPDGDTSTTDDVPDVILNSWGIPAGLFAPCDETFWQAIDNVEAAGIVTIFAAGNEGPTPKSIRNPADRTSSPINSFAVGAVDINKVIAGFSSRGPASCDTTMIKPEVVAPGVSIRSSTKGGTYAYMSGTSMAAPYIAGLVALCRQYNPDATVEQIKNALLQSAVDLGDPGEDNAYGHGLVDASKLLNYLPMPHAPLFTVVGKQIDGDGVASPGEQVGLYLRVTNSTGNIDYVSGQIRSMQPNSASILSDTARFYFGLGGTSAINLSPFTLAVNANLVNGSTVPFRIYLSNPAASLSDSVDLFLTVGYPAPGNSASIHTGRIDFTDADFAQYGLAQGSIYNLAGEGFRIDGGPNLLYEAGILVGRNSLQLSSSIRDSLGRFRQSSFRPTQPMGAPWVASDDGTHRTCAFSDTHSTIPIPVNVSHESIHYTTSGDNGFVILKYHLVNTTLQNQTNLYFGFMADFDLSAGADRVIVNSGMNIMYQQSGSGPVVGVVALTPAASLRALDNNGAKRGFKSSEEFSLISTPGYSTDSQVVGDRMFLVAAGPYDLAVGDSVEIALALVGGLNVDDMTASAVRALQRYSGVTAVNDGRDLTPTGFALAQNYPNPFNPSTTVLFSLPTAGDAKLEVFNVLGQRVRLLQSAYLSAGEHRVEWNGANDRGESVAGGVYFYRLTQGKFSDTRKMVLLK